MTHKTKEMLGRVEAGHARITEEVMDLQDTLSACSIQGLADIGFYLDQVQKLFDDLRKQTKGLSERAQKLGCARWIAEAQAGRNVQVVSNDYSISPDTGMSANIPSRSKDPEAYDKFMEWLGVPKELAESGLTRVHWPTLKEKLTEMQEQGLPLPPGISPDKTHPHFAFKYRKKNR